MKNNRGNKKNTFIRLIKTLFEFYPVLLPIIIALILFNSVVSSIPSVFMQNIIAVIEKYWRTKNWAQAQVEVFSFVSILAILYILSLIASFTYNRLMAVVTQGSLMKFREKMFARMESLPIRYFDTNAHGDIMSIYTNDTDTLRQLISQSLPALMQTSIVLLTVFCIMIYYSFWLTGVVLIGCVIMFFITKNFGSKSSRFFIKQQQTLGATEGYIEEMMNGQKVIKVFNHEEDAIAGFDKVNNAWFEASRKANTFANILMPVLHNMGNILYVLIALTGGVLLYLKTPNVSLSGMALNISIVVPFLNMTKQFTGQIGQISQQINSVVMGLAGASRIFGLLDEEPEFDEGYVTLVNAKEENGELVETTERTEMWAWKHPHEDGTVTYTRLEGDVEMHDVDFAYNPNKMILHNITLYAKPGQKVAFVGATGAGKTTITNLINRFYDIEDGKIRYDGININKIKKPDLRRSLGIILQDTNLFTGTVMDNIRYGYLEATDEQCIEAAKLAGADDFITRLPDGYNTMLTGNGASLSQGQRQLIAIARAAVADPPVMIMDEATSSIDTRTEAIVQKGMDALMKGRTVFVIAHRLSTVQNSDVIMVLDHGHIIERGSHDDLIKQKGQYYQLYTGAFELE
ncbi:ABC transporter ATP-binding protein [Catenibacterium sp. AM22-15]|uniref:ABC transporter ATP-binding protein n=1 Tax=unclassified Catenibacterium TaxID=2643636 RepID=UPI000E3F6A61|nr:MULTISPECIES: ABC transporter ATP-binding protein [unclassified Catenibacterium]RGE95456.1 ABC transporter ATP-binding protein [Catenibacterium sp. AM22-6LB]RGF02915.1 ABC transporter ATP-binding protein [Catenibacterium sp. AM22-15]